MTFTARDRWLFISRAVVSVVMLTSGLYVILSGRYPDATQKWAFGMVGLVAGYWLR
jgi:hypothetical protein